MKNYVKSIKVQKSAKTKLIGTCVEYGYILVGKARVLEISIMYASQAN